MSDPLTEYSAWSRLDVNENANRYQGPGSFFAWLLDKYLERDVANILPQHILKHHAEGRIYIHKLPHSVYIPYCTGHSISRLLRKGLKTVTVVSRPARHFDTFVDHVTNYLITMQHYFTGAQAMSSVEWYAGPFIRQDGLRFRDVKQHVQRLLYNLNYPTRIGLQTCFTNFTIVMDAPRRTIETSEAIHGGQGAGTLASYEDEAKLFLKALFSLYMEGDSVGQPFTFPIPTLMVSAKWIWDDPELHELVFKTAARKGSFYWLNTNVVDPEATYSMCLHSSELILFRHGGEVEVTTIGELFGRFAGELESKEPNGGEWYKVAGEVQVLAYNPATGALDWRRVSRFLVVQARRAVRVKLADGRDFIVTRDHPLLVMGLNGDKAELVPAARLLLMKSQGVDLSRFKIPVVNTILPEAISPNYQVENDAEQQLSACSPRERASYVEWLARAGTQTGEPGCWEVRVRSRTEAQRVLLLSALNRMQARVADGKILVCAERATGKTKPSVVWVRVEDVEEIVLPYNEVFIDVELEEDHYFVHSGGVITHNCCRLSVQINEMKHAYSSPTLRLSLKRDLEEERERYARYLERQKFGGLWAVPDITGSVNVVDVNLPRLAIESKKEESRFWELYEEALEIAREACTWFRQRYTRIMREYPSFYSMIIEYMPEFPAFHFNTIGLIGLPEAASILMSRPDLWTEGSHSDWLKAAELMRRIVEHATATARRWMMEEGVPWNVEEVPGESASPKLAALDARLYPDIREYLPDPENPVYSTSIAPYYAPMEIPERVEVEQRVQKYFTGGVMMHLFIGEEPDPESLAGLTKKLAQTDLVYWSLTPSLTFCYACNKTYTGLHTKCPVCGGEKVDIWSRIIGYYRPLRNWNPQRRREFWTRVHYSISI